MFAVPAAMSKAAAQGGAWVLAAMIGALSSHGPANLAVAAQQKSRGPAAPKTSPQFGRYQVAAGTALLLTLSTPLHSATANVDDQVEAVLWSPVIQDGVELVPEGSVVFGKVLEFVRASDRRPTGSITFAFKIIEHGATGSREPLSTRNIIMEAQRVVDSGPGKVKKRFDPIDVAVPAGMRLVAMTAEPLAVRIPR